MSREQRVKRQRADGGGGLYGKSQAGPKGDLHGKRDAGAEVGRIGKSRKKKKAAGGGVAKAERRRAFRKRLSGLGY